MPEVTTTRPANDVPAFRSTPALTAPLVGVLFAAALFTLVQIWLALTLVIPYNRAPSTDLNLFLNFGQMVLNDQSPYWTGSERGLTFVYQLWVILAYLPFAPLERELALRCWTVVNLIVLYGAVWLSWRAFLPQLRAIYLIPLYCLALAVCSSAIITGHATVIFLVAMSGSALLLQQGRYFQSGLPAFTLLIKPQLTFLAGLLWLALLLVKKPAKHINSSNEKMVAGVVRAWLAGAVIGFVVITGISLIIQSDWPLRLSEVNFLQTQGQTLSDGSYVEFLKSIMPGWLEFLFQLEQPWLGIISLAALSVAGLLGLGRLWQWRQYPATYLALALGLTLLITPYSHVYDFPPLYLVILVIIRQIESDWSHRHYRPALVRSLMLMMLFAIQPLSADYRWFYSLPLGIMLLAFSFGPGPDTDLVPSSLTSAID